MNIPTSSKTGLLDTQDSVIDRLLEERIAELQSTYGKSREDVLALLREQQKLTEANIQTCVESVHTQLAIASELEIVGSGYMNDCD